MVSEQNITKPEVAGYASEYTHRISSYETDFKSQIKLDALLSIFQEAAVQNANQLGFGEADLKAQNAFWALSKIKLKVEKMSVRNDQIIITTWPKSVDGLFALRDFWVSDENGNTLVRATSAWLMLDEVLRKPKRIAQTFQNFPVMPDYHAMDEGMEKLPVFEDMLTERELSTKYSDIDHNHHVSHLNYITWILDSFPKRQFEKRSIKSLHVNFNAEVAYGEKVKMLKSWDSQSNLVNYIYGKNPANGVMSFQSKICWE